MVAPSSRVPSSRMPSSRMPSSRMPSSRLSSSRVQSRWVRDLAIKSSVVDVGSRLCCQGGCGFLKQVRSGLAPYLVGGSDQVSLHALQVGLVSRSVGWQHDDGVGSDLPQLRSVGLMVLGSIYASTPLAQDSLRATQSSFKLWQRQLRFNARLGTHRFPQVR